MRLAVVGFPDDPALQAVLRSLGISPNALAGHGSEAWVYVLDDERVVRVLHEGRDGHEVRLRQSLVDELVTSGAPFELPLVLDVDEVDGRWFAIERRLPGATVMHQLEVLTGRDRDLLVEHHLAASAALGNLHLQPRDWFGDLLAPDPVRSEFWRGYLRERAARSLTAAGPTFPHVDPSKLADGMPEPVARAFVHLDAFAGNMLAIGTSITAVIDIGGKSAVVGDAKLNPVATSVYLSSPLISPTATSRDADVAASWLRSAGLADYVEPAHRWLAAFWSHAMDELRLHEWCRSVLVAS